MSAYQVILWVVPGVLIATAVVLLLRTQLSHKEPRPPADYQLFGPGARDDDRYWLAGGFFYNNPDDPALFVLNRWGFGITPNLAHPQASRVAIGVLLILAMIPILLMVFFPGLSASGNGCHPFSGCHLYP